MMIMMIVLLMMLVVLLLGQSLAMFVGIALVFADELEVPGPFLEGVSVRL
jgi:hypothetical protein